MKKVEHTSEFPFGIYWWTFFCHFGPSFALLLSPPPNNQKKQNLKKNEKSIWRCHHFKLVQQKAWSYDVCLLRYGVRQREFTVILGHFLLFFPTYWPQKSTIGKKCKKHLKILSFHICVPYIKIIWSMVPEI